VDTIEYFMHTLAYGVIFYLCVGAPVALFLSILEQFGPGLIRSVGRPLAALCLVGGLFCSGWLSRQAAHRRTVLHEGFIEALMGALDEARTYLAFLPLGGQFIRARGHRDSRFDKPPEPR